MTKVYQGLIIKAQCWMKDCSVHYREPERGTRILTTIITGFFIIIHGTHPEFARHSDEFPFIAVADKDHV